MRKYVVEFIGTFFLVCGAILGGAIGASLLLMVAIYAGGHISGAHYNPAVTVAMWIRRKIDLSESLAYWVAQFFGAAAAAVLLRYVFEKEGHAMCNIPDAEVTRAIIAEFLGTFLLAYVVLHVATTRGTSGNSFYGLAIAGTVLGCAMTFGQSSGGVFNPGVGVALGITSHICWEQLWMYFVGPIGGGILAAIVFNYLNVDDKKVPPVVTERGGDGR